MKRLAAGVYVDDEGALHLVMPEILRANGYADTPENRKVFVEAWAKWATTEDADLEVTDDPLETKP